MLKRPATDGGKHSRMASETACQEIAARGSTILQQRFCVPFRQARHNSMHAGLLGICEQRSDRGRDTR